MRLIDADALELILNNAIEMMRTMAKALDSEDDPEIQMEIKAYTDILNGVKEQPTIEPERKPGKWKRDADGLVWCITCGFGKERSDERPYRFCPNCGAKMEEGDRE